MLRGCPRDRVSSGGGSALSVPGWNHSQSSGHAGWLRWFSLLSRDLTRDPSPVKPTSCLLYGTQKEMSCFSCGLSQTYLALGSHYECFHVLLPVIKRKKNVKKKSHKRETKQLKSDSILQKSTFIPLCTGHWSWQLLSEVSTEAPHVSLNKWLQRLEAFLVIPAHTEDCLASPWCSLPLPGFKLKFACLK